MRAVAPETLRAKFERDTEREQQIAEYRKFKRQKERRMERDIREISEYWSLLWDHEYEWKPKFKPSLRQFIEELDRFVRLPLRRQRSELRGASLRLRFYGRIRTHRGERAAPGFYFLKIVGGGRESMQRIYLAP